MASYNMLSFADDWLTSIDEILLSDNDTSRYLLIGFVNTVVYAYVAWVTLYHARNLLSRILSGCHLVLLIGVFLNSLDEIFLSSDVRGLSTVIDFSIKCTLAYAFVNLVFVRSFICLLCTSQLLHIVWQNYELVGIPAVLTISIAYIGIVALIAIMYKLVSRMTILPPQ